MSIIVFDCETTGVNARTARLVELAAYHMSGEPPFTLIEQMNVLVQPSYGEIPRKATAVHGITTEQAADEGIALIDALDIFSCMLSAADERMQLGRLVAHNFRYDNAIVAGEMTRIGLPLTDLASMRPFCTMEAMTDRCALPKRSGDRFPARYKWPRLVEAYTYCFNERPDEDVRPQHRAFSDVLTCRDIFIHGVTQGWWR